MRKRLRKIVYSNALLYELAAFIRKIRENIFSKANYTIENKGFARIIRDIQGDGHSICIEEGCVLKNVKFHIRGHNNTIIFEKDCVVGNNCSFWMEGNNILITIGAGTTFTHTVHFCAQESGVSIRVGKDCMFSNNIIVRTSDSHPIYSLEDGTRINPAKNVIIGDHVWIAPNTKIMKGAIIGSGAVIGSDTMVTKTIPENALAVGHPAVVVKNGIKWTRESLF